VAWDELRQSAPISDTFGAASREAEAGALMATAAYWEKQKEHLLNPVYGPLKLLVPMEDAALLGNGPMFANQDAVKLSILGYAAEARSILDAYVPRLRDHAAKWLAIDVTAAAGTSIPDLLQALSVGIWLRDGAFDPQIARAAFETYLQRATMRGQLNRPELTPVMLLGLEAGRDEEVARLYMTHQEKPYEEFPKDGRFANGPRHLMGLTARFAHDLTVRERLKEGIMRFAERGRAWDRRIDPIPYISLVTLARIVRQCLSRVGHTPDALELWKLVR
jgi:hypothetical protein